VHAREFFVYFDSVEKQDDSLIQRLNYNLPEDIVVHELIPVHDKANPRYDALSRSYKYFIHFDKNPFLARYSAHYPVKKLDIDLLRQGLEFYKKMTDFRHVCKTPERMNTTICNLTVAALCERQDEAGLIFQFTANRFLKSMIRIILARLVELATGKIDYEQFCAINNGKTVLKYPTVAPPQGLHLWSIKYPYLK
jgi:tRNA pseudouridine38-40 synthase